jgi:6-phosphogluconate dehydrogenase (decarboxylating)
MQIGMVGIGRMDASMVTRLYPGGHVEKPAQAPAVGDLK